MWVLACVFQCVCVCVWMCVSVSLHVSVCGYVCGCMVVCGVHSVYVWPRCGVCLLFCARGRRRFRCIHASIYLHVYLYQCWYLYLWNLSCTCERVCPQVSVCRGVRVHMRLSVNCFQVSVSISVHVNVHVYVHENVDVCVRV